MSEETPNRILEFLTARPKPDGEASRGNQRRPTSSRMELNWSEGGLRRISRGRLINISRGGAGLKARESPPVGSLARVRLTEGEGSPWVEVRVLGIEPEPRGRQRIRVRFEGHCPSFLLRMAILGGLQPEENEPEFTQAATWQTFVPKQT